MVLEELLEAEMAEHGGRRLRTQRRSAPQPSRNVHKSSALRTGLLVRVACVVKLLVIPSGAIHAAGGSALELVYPR